MEYIAIVLFGLAAVTFVTYPLFGRRKTSHALERGFDLGDSKQLEYLMTKRDRIDENIRELDFEYEMGKLAEHDYKRIRNGYAKESEQVSKAIGKLKIRKDIEELIEGEVQSRRRIK